MLEHLVAAAEKRRSLLTRLATAGTRALRLVSDLEEPLDLDAYGLEDGGWVLFAQVNEKSFLKRLEWGDVARAMSGVLGGPVRAIGGAVKTPDGSQPLPMPFRESGGAAGPWVTTEGNACFKLELDGVLNPGLFFDQRENRVTLRRLIAERGPGLLANFFSYTGAFSVTAAREGCDVLSVDLSKRYLSWEGENHALNGTSARSKRIPEDSGTYLRRLEHRVSKPDGARRPDFIVLDPPTFSRNDGKRFRVREALPGLVEKAVACLSPRGVLLVSTNDARWPRSEFESETSEWGARLGLDVLRGAVGEDCEPPGVAGEYALKSAWLLRRG